MKIGIDVSPLESGHKVRGVGFYLHYLKESLASYFPAHDYLFFTGKVPKDPSIDVIHYPYFDPFFLTLPFLKSRPTIVTVHDLIPLVFPQHFPAGYKGMAKWQLQRLALRNCHAVITDSQSSKEDIIAYTGISPEKVFVVYLAAGKEFVVQRNRKLEKDNLKKYNLPDKYVLYVGDATWNKNLPALLEAVKKAETPLIMVGKTLASSDIDPTNLWNRDALTVQSLAKENSKVHILGFVPTEDLVTLYNNAVLTVLPSLYEGFGLTILEAMSCGSPVVTTKRGSIPEVAGEAAWYVDPTSSSSIASGISEVFYNVRMQQSLSQKGLEQAARFSWEKTARETVEVYLDAIPRPSEVTLSEKAEKQKKHYERQS